MQKKLFDELLIDTEEEKTQQIKLTYYLLTDSVREEYCDLKVYGVQITKEDIFDGKPCNKESKVVRNLFFRHSEAEAFLKKLVCQSVTPMGLMSAVSEHINEQICSLTYEG